jgi:hypothetical protein
LGCRTMNWTSFRTILLHWWSERPTSPFEHWQRINMTSNAKDRVGSCHRIYIFCIMNAMLATETSLALALLFAAVRLQATA